MGRRVPRSKEAGLETRRLWSYADIGFPGSAYLRGFHPSLCSMPKSVGNEFPWRGKSRFLLSASCFLFNYPPFPLIFFTATR
jgi:hypothetical protein